jgi:cyclopropane fatty-acyl-phospholipid synthase-like methyltransferase
MDEQISEYFKKVIGTDVAVEQLKHAVQRPNITYMATPTILSEEDLARVVGPEGSVDLVIVTEALHWFDLDSFYKNVKHVLRKPGGVFATTVYRSRPQISEAVNKVLDEFYAAIEQHWSPRVQLVEDEYRNLPFPFTSIPQAEGSDTPSFEATMNADLDQFLSYLETWSAVQTAIDKGLDPLNEKQRRVFAKAWGSPETVRCLRWPLVVRVGTVPTES